MLNDRATNEPLVLVLPRILDWHQLRVLLSEALGKAAPGTPDRWSQVAELINARCPKSQPLTGSGIEQAFRRIVALDFPGAARLETDSTVGHDVWTRLFYELCRHGFDAQQSFLNLGYEGPEIARSFELRPEDESSRAYIQIYDQLIGDCPLAGRSILEIGCGWGGGCAYMAGYFAPRRVVGLDLVESNVAACRRHAPAATQSFVVGNATALPLAAASFDVVANVESSHNYKSFPDFVQEVRRVLVPGGTFLFGDLRPTEDAWHSVRTTIHDAGFALLRETDLTSGVLQAMASSADAKRAVLRDGRFDGMDRSAIAEIMLCPGSMSYERLKTSAAQFRVFTFEKRSE
jgi:ubiquinone/menaquinone biosynthesis C-methylase UbiE